MCENHSSRARERDQFGPATTCEPATASNLTRNALPVRGATVKGVRAGRSSRDCGESRSLFASCASCHSGSRGTDRRRRPSQQPLLLTPTASTRHFSLQYDNGDRNMAFQLKGFGPQLEISNQIQHTMRKPDIEALNPAALLLHVRRPNFVPLVDSSWNPRRHDISEG